MVPRTKPIPHGGRWPVVTAIAALSLVFSSGAARAASSDAIVVRDDCTGRIVAMNADGTGRHALANVGSNRFSDVSRAGPITVIGTTWIVPGDRNSPLGLYALDVAGTAPVWLLQGDQARAGFWTFSPDGNHVAAARAVTDAAGVQHSNVEIWDVIRDAATGRISTLANASFVMDLLTLGSRSDSNVGGSIFSPASGYLDFSPDGRSLVAVIYEDLWRIDLSADGRTFVGATALTRTKNFGEVFARWSPSGNAIAFYGGPYSAVHSPTQGSATSLKPMDFNVYTLTLASGVVRALTTSGGGATASGPEYPSWSRDGASIIYDAPAISAKKTASCGAANRDIFRIPANGSGPAANITNSIGTSLETEPHWAWQ
jgi:hypothetical protein